MPVTTRLCVALMLCGLVGCASGPAVGPAPVQSELQLRFPPIARGPVSATDEVAAARLMGEAKDAFEAGDFGRAGAAAGELAVQFPTAPGAAEALWVLGQASLEVGESERAVAATESLLEVLDVDHPVANDARLLRAEALHRTGDLEASTQAYLDLPADLVTDDVMGRIAEAAEQLDRDVLDRLVTNPSGGSEDPRLGPLLAELALGSALDGDFDQARRLASDARAAGVAGRAGQILDAVEAGDVTAFLPMNPVIGMVLPVSGSPSNRDYTERFLEGVEVALQMYERQGIDVELVVEDNAGTQAGSEQAYH